jgi:hypothetical protein
MPDDVKLNSLSRYSKQSPRLVLEEYSHCEIPAGCGGVVLRWRKPDQEFAIVFRSGARNGRTPYVGLDGQDTDHASKHMLKPGTHVLAIQKAEVDPSKPVLLFAAQVEAQYQRILELQGDTSLLSLGDGSWKYSLAPQADEAWQAPDFDDSAWPALQAQPKKKVTKKDAFWDEEILELGAHYLWLDRKAEAVQAALAASEDGKTLSLSIRKVFTILSKAQ